MATVTEVRALAFQYLLKSIDHKEFTRRFFKIFYGIKTSGDSNAVMLVSTLRPIVADAVTGLIGENDFRVAVADAAIDIQVLSSRVARSQAVKEKDVFSPYEPAELTY